MGSMSGSHHGHDDHYDPQPVLTRNKSSRSTAKQRPVSRHVSAKTSRTTMYSLPAHFETDGDDVTLYVLLPWMELLNERPCRFHITGVDGKSYSLEVDYRFTGMVHGSAKFRGAGLPHSRERGRGKLVVEWELVFPQDDAGNSSGSDY